MRVWQEDAVREPDLVRFSMACGEVGVAVPEPLERGLRLLRVAAEHAEAPAGSLLEMADDDVRARITDLAIRQHSEGGATMFASGMRPGIAIFKHQLLEEIREAMLPELDTIVESLQPAFDTAVAPFVRAAQDYGFSFNTTSDEVIDLADEEASQAWRDTREAWSAIGPLARFRVLMSKVFNLSPTPYDAGHDLGGMERLSYSVLFAAGENWAYDGTYQLSRKPGAAIDWLALAVGGLHLNTPAEVDAKVR